MFPTFYSIQFFLKVIVLIVLKLMNEQSFQFVMFQEMTFPIKKLLSNLIAEWEM